MSYPSIARSFAICAALVVAGCTTANIGGNVATAPLPTGSGSPEPSEINPVRGAAVEGAEPATLGGGVWVLSALGDTAVEPASRNPAHLSFAETNRVVGATGCNRLTGDVKVDPKSMRFGALVTTRMACPDEGNVETRFLAALEATRSWQVQTGRLTLRDAEGRTVATLTQRDSVAQ